MKATPTYDPARLRELIERTGRSLRAVARDLDVDHRYLGRIAGGEITPGADKLAAILAACGATWADLDGPG